MAVVQNPITGRTRQSFSTATFTKVYRQNVMRSKPSQVSNPKTLGQTSQRTAFANVNTALKNLLPLIQIGFKNFQTKMAPFSYASKRSLKEAVSGIAGSRVVDFTKLSISDGRLTPLTLVSKSYTPGTGILNIEINPNIKNDYDSADDKVAIGVYTPENEYTYINTYIGSRYDANFDVTLDNSKITANSVFYLFPWSDVPTLATPKVKFKAGAELAGKVK